MDLVRRVTSQYRRGLLLLVAALASTVGPAASALAQVRAEAVAEGLVQPVAIVPDPVTPGVLFVAQQNGLVRVLVNASVLPTPFLDLQGQIIAGGESGLLGLAFAPDAASRRVFVNFTNLAGDTVVARFLRSADNPLVVDPGTRFDLRWPSGARFIDHPEGNHFGGNLVFGPDGCLFIGLGDGGGPTPDPLNAAQTPTTLFGKMLRIDVNVPDEDPVGYRVPANNPFVGFPQALVLHEIWAFGFRNPWRYSFDDFGPGATGALIVADVGQDSREEINYEPAGRGGRNYGWRAREGTIATPGMTETVPAYLPFTEPIVDYGRDIGGSITGGFVYGGRALPASFQGRYFVGDFVSRRIFSVGIAVDAGGEAHIVDALEHTSELGNPGRILTFGRDLAGELYFATTNGMVYRIAPVAPPSAPVNLSSTVDGSNVTLTWEAGAGGGGGTTYQLEAGSKPGSSDVLVAPFATTRVEAVGVASGLYHVRVRALNAAGTSDASNEITVAVGCAGPPAPPVGFAVTVRGHEVTLSWGAVAGATAYQVEAGSGPGAADIALIPTGSPGLAGVVPPNTYFVRVRAENACGAGAASEEIVVPVPQ